MNSLMKKILILSSLVIFSASSVLAVSPKEATSPAKEKELKIKVQELKERVATRVAQMKLLGKRAIWGEIKSITGNTLVISTKRGERVVETNEETKFWQITRGKRAAIKFSDLAIGEKVHVLGLLNKETETLSAKIIIVRTHPINFQGKVKEVDVKGGTITVENLKQEKTWVVDVEATTKIFVWKKGEGLVKSGLSKIEIGDRVHVLATSTKEGESVSALRILVLPGLATGITGEKPTEPTPSP